MHKNLIMISLQRIVMSISIPMMVSYNSDQLVKDRFKDGMLEFDLTYTMRSVGEVYERSEERKELYIDELSIMSRRLLINYDRS